jgi:aspartate 1-decarboxylase
MLKSKIHRATVTDANLNYVGSISLDPELMDLADILENEQVAILDIDNGARFETYAIKGKAHDVCLNGAAARLVQPGDKIIIITYADYNNEELKEYRPIIVHVDQNNNPVEENVVVQASRVLSETVHSETVHSKTVHSKTVLSETLNRDILQGDSTNINTSLGGSQALD